MESRRPPRPARRPAAASAVLDEAIAEVFEEHESLPNGSARLDPEFRLELIRRAAYALAEQRGFEPGRELDDWLAAEASIDRELAVVAPEP